MELVPIIVSALKIVIVIALIAITVSYVINKIKLKKGTAGSSEKRLANSAFYAEQKVKNVVKRITKNIQYPKPDAQLKQDKEKRARVDSTSKSPTKRFETINSIHQTKIEKSGRIEIIKTLNPNISSEDDESISPKSGSNSTKKNMPSEEKNMASLGDQILDKYSEDENGDMYTLNTKKDSKKNK